MLRDKPPESPSDPIRTTFSQKIPKSVRQRIVRPNKIVLDWKAYFLQFCQEHGEPIEYGNVLLFRDGWRYAMEYQGPEYPPPPDHRELDILVMKYWLGRLRICNKLLGGYIAEKDRIIGLMGSHSLPLQQVVMIDRGDSRSKGIATLDTRSLDEKIIWLREDIKECEEMLKEIEEFHAKNNLEKD